MKTAIFVSALFACCLIANPLFAQKMKSDAVLESPLVAPEKSQILPGAQMPEPAVLPKEEEKPLVGVQESKVKVKAKAQVKAPTGPGRYDEFVEPLIITATRSARPMSRLAVPVTVITRDQIEREGDMQLIDALRSVPGVNVVRNGTRGRTASVFIRGANSNHTLFMINGVQVSSPATGVFDPTNLTLEDVERIEVIRGPQSTLYGSEAIGGVINIITRQGRKGRPRAEGQFEFGSERTFHEAGTLSGGFGPVTYFGSFSRIDSAVGVRSRRLEKDSYEDTNASGRLTIDLPMNSKIDTTYKFTNGYSPIDDGAFTNDFNAWGRTKENLVTTALTMNPFSWLTEAVKFSLFHSRYVMSDPPDNLFDFPMLFKLDSKIYTLDWQSTIRPFESNTITAGYEYEVQIADNRTFDKILRNNGFYIQDEQSFWDRLFLTGGVRLEDNGAFGRDLNPKFSAAYLLKETGTKFKGSFGTGFRAPSLNDLYFPFFGTPTLRPEESRTYEWGFEQELPIWNGRLEMDLYHTHFKNLIQAVPGGVFGFVAGNAGKVTTDGMEWSVSIEPIPGFMKILGNYTFLHTENKSTDGGPLLRRPKHAGGVNVNFHFWEKWNVNLDALFTGNRQDASFVFTRPARETAKGFGILNFMVSYDLFDNLELYLRAENVTDNDYEEVLGFQNSGALIFGGLKAKV